MLKSLFPQVDWDTIKAVGLDVDGTLYDEFEFIAQVYKPIAQLLARVCRTGESEVYQSMIRRWLEKGSSYNRIFEEILSRHSVKAEDRPGSIAQCLLIYRNFRPNLVLPSRMKSLLEYIHGYYEIFIVTDGSFALQQKKVEALRLKRWVKSENVLISGKYGPEFQKPATLILSKLPLLQTVNPDEIVFFGDREQDRQFAGNSGFHFIKLKYFSM
ncbi:Hypothetical protein LUCI_0747 [Lucifera butyrica]|uniref:Haloacid dehalogenase-like hydrolase n=1 Tax=Lucifera butyrica TaxID=1351585 RepID=A0A498R3W2_9FIRM|nr:HAD family hydrolase [Lucifera butyrica]VBB05537.1 Hypothetical protein LUCI_0747 [Lucifera butyrica]